MSASNSPTLDSNVSMSTYVQSPGSSEDAGGLVEKSLAEKSTGSDQSDESKADFFGHVNRGQQRAFLVARRTRATLLA